MNKFKCPHCGLKLGAFYYADACPHCHVGLEHNNMARLTVTPKKDPLRRRAWPVRLFFRIVRFVES